MKKAMVSTVKELTLEFHSSLQGCSMKLGTTRALTKLNLWKVLSQLEMKTPN
jgi:hypothetical protein